MCSPLRNSGSDIQQSRFVTGRAETLTRSVRIGRPALPAADHASVRGNPTAPERDLRPLRTGHNLMEPARTGRSAEPIPTRREQRVTATEDA